MDAVERNYRSVSLIVQCEGEKNGVSKHLPDRNDDL